MIDPNPFTIADGFIIGSTEALVPETYIVLDEKPTLNAEGWDDMVITYYTLRPTLTAEELAADFPLGTQLGERKWWVVGSRPECLGPGVWKAEVQFKGWAYTKPQKISVGSAAEQQSAENITIGGEGTFSRVSVQENTPTMNVTYLVEDWTTAPTNFVGTAVTPPDAVDVPDSFWDYLPEFTFHYPYGWVLMSCEPDRLQGCDAALVKMTYKYIRAITP